MFPARPSNMFGYSLAYADFYRDAYDDLAAGSRDEEDPGGRARRQPEVGTVGGVST